MVAVGTLAPSFGCSAWIGGRVRRLNWSGLHDGKSLLLLFVAQAARVSWELRELNRAAHRLGALGAKAAVVCHGPVRLIERWAEVTLARGEPLALTVIVDPEDYLAALYDLVSEDGAVRWGQFIIDAAGLVRQVEICRCRIAANADELVRFASGITNEVIEERNHL